MEPLRREQALPTAATLAAAGVRITLVSAGLAATRVDVEAPPALASIVRDALRWRMDAMRTQIRAAQGLGGRARTPVAVPNVRPRMAPVQRWSGYAESYGRTFWQERSAQRPESGWCASCDEPHASAGETGDCMLCNAARVGALRAEGVIPAATPRPPRPAPMTEAEWRTLDASGLHALPPVPPRRPWKCEVCGFENIGLRRDVEGCGPCANKADATMDCSRLGGSGRARNRIDMGAGTFAIVCTRGRGARTKPCVVCRRDGTRLCDGVLPTPSGKTRVCSVALCVEHSMRLGSGSDYCPDCAAARGFGRDR